MIQTCKEYIDATISALEHNHIPACNLYQDDPVATWRYIFRVIGHGLAEYSEKELQRELSRIYGQVVKQELGHGRGVTIDNKDIIGWMMDARQEHIDRMDELKLKRVEMSGKYVTVEYSQKHKYYYLSWGRETFYDDDNYMRTWSTPQEAADWLKENRTALLLVEVNDPLDGLPTIVDEYQRAEPEQMEMKL